MREAPCGSDSRQLHYFCRSQALFCGLAGRRDTDLTHPRLGGRPRRADRQGARADSRHLSCVLQVIPPNVDKTLTASTEDLTRSIPSRPSRHQRTVNAIADVEVGLSHQNPDVHLGLDRLPGTNSVREAAPAPRRPGRSRQVAIAGAAPASGDVWQPERAVAVMRS